MNATSPNLFQLVPYLPVPADVRSWGCCDGFLGRGMNVWLLELVPRLSTCADLFVNTHLQEPYLKHMMVTTHSDRRRSDRTTEKPMMLAVESFELFPSSPLSLFVLLSSPSLWGTEPPSWPARQGDISPVRLYSKWQFCMFLIDTSTYILWSTLLGG